MTDHDVIDRLLEIRNLLEDLSGEASELFRDNFPQLYARGDAYGAFTFGSSVNPYDTTFASLLEDIGEEY